MWKSTKRLLLRTDWGTAVATIVLAIITGWLAYETKRLGTGTDDLNRTAQIQAQISSRLATAYEHSNELTRNVYRDSVRPLLAGALHLESRNLPNTAIREQWIEFEVTNVGHGPALHVVATLNTAASPVLGPHIETVKPDNKNIAASSQFLKSGESMKKISQNYHESGGMSLRSIAADARIDYIDIDGKAYHRTYCLNDPLCKEEGD